MTNFARIVGGTAVDVTTETPASRFHPDLAAAFVPVPDNVGRGWTFDGDTWTAPVLTGPAAAIFRKQISRVEFMLLFTQDERLAIKAARTDTSTAEKAALAAVLNDFFEIIEDPQLTHVDLDLAQTLKGLNGLEAASLIGAGRAEEIARGIPV